MSEQELSEHHKGGVYSQKGKSYERDTRYIPTRLVKEPAPGSGDVKIEPGRYRLIAAKACPWANRTLIIRHLLGLEEVLPVGMPGPTHDADSWTFDLDPGGKDPVLGIHKLKDAYLKRDPEYSRGITVPAIVDTADGAVVTNDFDQITRDFSSEWVDYHRDGAPNLWPEDKVEEMEQVMRRIYTEVNNGVYRAGFAGSQESYEEAYERLWTAMDWLEERLSTQRYLMGDYITEADIRLYTTLARFDAVYHGHFKASRNKLTEMPALWGYARDLYQTPGFAETTDFDQIKKHYYIVHSDINPSGIVPVGPDPKVWLTEHGREKFGGGPFSGPSTTGGQATAPVLK